MQKKLIPLVGASAVALVAAAALTSTASAHGTDVAVVGHGTVSVNKIHPDKKGNCYSNLMADTGVGILSQTFGDSPEYDSLSATNFAVKKTCKVTSVYAPGAYFNGAGPATSETVTFYADDADGVPGTVESTQTVVGSDNAGTFTIPLETVALSPGKHWVSVSANMDFAVGGEWGWELTSNVKKTIEGQFENTGGGFGVCPTWGNVTECVGYSGDFMVTLGK